jgi:hypothetical protein
VFLSRGSTAVTIDLGTIGETDRQKLERLVTDARFFELPAMVPAPRGSHQRVCRITVEEAGRRHSVSAHDPVQGPALQALIDCLSQFASSHGAHGQRVHGPHSATVRGDDDYVVPRVQLKI